MNIAAATSRSLASELDAHRKFLWGMCYRMTGCAADADDLVQDTFARALEQPPADTTRELRPWLVRVAMNAARDLLRMRRRRGYQGPYLPSPVETAELTLGGAETCGPEARYGELESVTFAFLLALEALSATQRAVLLLRDVFDYSVQEVSEILGMGESNVKTTHHRARRALRDYDRARCIPTPELQQRSLVALETLFNHFANDDVDGLRALLAEDVVTLNDADGEFFAAGRPIVGREKVILFHRNVTQKLQRFPQAFAIRSYNGLPALLAVYPPSANREPPRVLMRAEIDADGRIVELQGVVATRKLTATDFSHLQRVPRPSR